MRYIKIREGVVFISNMKQSLEEHKLNIKTRSEGNRENKKKSSDLRNKKQRKKLTSLKLRNQ